MGVCVGLRLVEMAHLVWIEMSVDFLQGLGSDLEHCRWKLTHLVWCCYDKY